MVWAFADIIMDRIVHNSYVLIIGSMCEILAKKTSRELKKLTMVT